MFCSLFEAEKFSVSFILMSVNNIVVSSAECFPSLNFGQICLTSQKKQMVPKKQGKKYGSFLKPKKKHIMCLI
jgi:hypothetical protein